MLTKILVLEPSAPVPEPLLYAQMNSTGTLNEVHWVQVLLRAEVRGAQHLLAMDKTKADTPADALAETSE